MKLLRATIAALVIAVSGTALPAFATTGEGTGGASYSEEQQQAYASEVERAEFRIFKATWYGPGLYGNRTACGQRLTRSLQGVAHKRLRCGTRVALRYAGRTVVVPVVDRGPFARGIEFDLTYATAKRLGMTQTSRVRAATLRR